jgi:hypothetical protein
LQGLSEGRWDGFIPETLHVSARSWSGIEVYYLEADGQAT